MRVYLPATLSGLAGLLHKAEIGPAPLRAFAVTPALREWYASGDLEELEYVAMMHAARASLRLLVADPEAQRRRVVLAADMPEQQVGTTAAGFDEPTLVEVLAPVPLARVVSGHIDDEVAMADGCPPRTRATRTPGSWWTAPKATNCSGTPARSCRAWPAERPVRHGERISLPRR